MILLPFVRCFFSPTEQPNNRIVGHCFVFFTVSSLHTAPVTRVEMPKTKKDALGHAIIKNKAQIVRSKKQELREK